MQIARKKDLHTTYKKTTKEGRKEQQESYVCTHTYTLNIHLVIVSYTSRRIYSIYRRLRRPVPASSKTSSCQLKEESCIAATIRNCMLITTRNRIIVIVTPMVAKVWILNSKMVSKIKFKAALVEIGSTVLKATVTTTTIVTATATAAIKETIHFHSRNRSNLSHQVGTKKASITIKDRVPRQ